ncbi:UDP-N-acetylglucosamine transferase subunit ALG14 [Rhynchospora pubera]|uniref:UDP-N-acetylglucosamine transferase subunit ALG14 n=1 Tax=Rhynchospora pubera TaxID=906938 RepID=A0AAV8ECG3_9POAL|nr:UDP-N-acetylglucosamine transferase subunit ALG14 [Rhynchospora pubera]
MGRGPLNSLLEKLPPPLSQDASSTPQVPSPQFIEFPFRFSLSQEMELDFLTTIALIVSLLVIRVTYVLYWTGRPFKRAPTTSLRTMIVLGSGGHTAEMLSIVNVLQKDKYAPRSYVAALTDNMSLQKAQVYEESLQNHENNVDKKRGGAQFMQIYRSREVGQSYITSIGTTIVAIIHAMWIVLKLRPQVIIGWRWCTTIYIESIARVKKLSLSGFLLYKLPLADQFFVQWPLLQQKFPRSQYAGRVM